MTTFTVTDALYPHEQQFLEALAGAVQVLGHKRVARGGDFRLKWGAALTTDDRPTIHCELGWLPRWSYQASWGGINADHDDAGQWAPALLELPGLEKALDAIRAGHGMPRGGWGYCDPTVAPYEGFRAEYTLVPLQVPEDSNMRHVPPTLNHPQKMIDALCEGATNPLYFKQHPARSEQNRPLHVKPPHKLIPHRQAQIAALLKSPQCRGVITANSNVLHDALLWGKPVVALGLGFWGKPVAFQPGTPEVAGYIMHVLSTQWQIADTKRLEWVAKLMGEVPN